MLIRSDMSGMSVLSGLRASVETFPLWWAFPTAEYDARYDSPNRIWWAFPVTVLLHLPGTCSTTVRRFQHCSVSGFPLPCLRSCRPYTVVFHGRNVWGLPSSSTSLFLHATA